VGRLYVHALTDKRVRAWHARGCRIESVAVGTIYAVCERRSAAPVLSEEELRHQHSIVIRIAGHVPSVLPARFGSLVDEQELSTIVRQRASAIDEAMALVRGKVQMTVRVRVERAAAKAPVARPTSGTQYLEAKRREVSPLLPPGIEAGLKRVAGHVVRERRQATPAGSVAVYHLVHRQDADAYRSALDGIDGATVSGPWPPFAFVPELWS